MPPLLLHFNSWDATRERQTGRESERVRERERERERERWRERDGERERERVRVTLLIQFYPHLMIFKNRNLFLASPIPGGGRSGDHFWMNRG